MKTTLKKLLPFRLLQFLRNLRVPKEKSIFRGKATSEVFTQIYETNHWTRHESVSGAGSDEIQTKHIIDQIGDLIKEYNISSVLDLPCGDFSWMNKVDLTNVHYTGADIVEPLISANNERYAQGDSVKFLKLDLIRDNLPKCDLIINRDCLVHLSFDDIRSAVRNIKNSGSKFILSTTFIRHPINYDITTGDWRTLNLQQRPFNFPSPIAMINENCPEDGSSYSDKSLGLWRVEDL